MKDLGDYVSACRLQKLQSSPGYVEATQLFSGMFYGGEPALYAFKAALLVFFEANNSPKKESIGDSMYCLGELLEKIEATE